MGLRGALYRADGAACACPGSIDTPARMRAAQQVLTFKRSPFDVSLRPSVQSPSYSFHTIKPGNDRLGSIVMTLSPVQIQRSIAPRVWDS